MQNHGVAGSMGGAPVVDLGMKSLRSWIIIIFLSSYKQILRIFGSISHIFTYICLYFFRACRHHSTTSAKWGRHLIPFAPPPCLQVRATVPSAPRLRRLYEAGVTKFGSHESLEATLCRYDFWYKRAKVKVARLESGCWRGLRWRYLSVIATKWSLLWYYEDCKRKPYYSASRKTELCALSHKNSSTRPILSGKCQNIYVHSFSRHCWKYLILDYTFRVALIFMFFGDHFCK